MHPSQRVGRFVVAVAVAMLAACGQTGSEGSADPTVAGSETTATPTSSSQSVTVSTVPVMPSSPTTAEGGTGDLTDPAAWIGHVFEHSTMFDPFAAVTLDGNPTGWIGGTEQCTFTQPPPLDCIGFVRVDPGGYGHAETEPTTWLVISWRTDGAGQQKGIVYDAEPFTTTSASMWPVGNCELTDGSGGAGVGVVQHDDTYVPVGDEDVDNAAHPVVAAWALDADLQVVEQPAAAVACRLYEYGD